MRYMKIVEAENLDDARRSYVALLNRSGIAVGPGAQVFVETVHRDIKPSRSWLCYIAAGSSRKAA